jgi:hypothetical protein
MEINQPKKVKLEMRGSKLRSGVNWPWYIGNENGFSLSMFLCM